MQAVEADSVPYPVELQSYNTMTQYCWNSVYTGANPATSTYNGNYCVPSTTLDGSQYTYPQALPPCLLALSDCTDDPSEDALELPEDVADCTRWNVQEVGYLAQRFYAMDDFEVYHSDLDDESCVFHMFWATRFTNKEPPISQIKSHPFHGFGSPISRK